jgi:hypothetical protein
MRDVPPKRYITGYRPPPPPPPPPAFSHPPPEDTGSFGADGTMEYPPVRAGAQRGALLTALHRVGDRGSRSAP